MRSDAPNGMPHPKDKYLGRVLAAGHAAASAHQNHGAALLDYALFMYHAEVPLGIAERYIRKYVSKLE
jgi:hypothetical protein